MQKITTQQITTDIMPVSPHTIIRYAKTPASGFPHPQRIGRINYFDKSAVFTWLNSRATRNGKPAPAGTIRTTDRVCDTSDVSNLLGRSAAWVWSNITKNPKLSIIDLSPTGESKNPRRYFIAREILAEFKGLAEVTNQEVA